ncbi:MAG: M23 family metallopeptidase [Sandaracinus sp.]
MRRIFVLAIVLVGLAGVPPALATPGEESASPASAEVEREAEIASAEAEVEAQVASEEEAEAGEGASAPSTGEARAPRPFVWSDGPRRVATPRGASLARAESLGLGTLECAHALLRGAPDDRWIAAARGRAPSRLLWPVDEGRWVRGFGYVRRTRPDLIHRGADIAGDEGATVRAAADGIVAYSDNGLHGYGNVVLLVHANGWMTLYAHNSRTTVQAGYRVHRGERIALVGHTGIAHGPHVHFELWDRGHAIDPAALFDGGPRYIQRLGERAAARGEVPAPHVVTDADRPVEAPLAPHPDEVAAPRARHAGARRR